jgi:uncharacterized membrane protein YdjX (TVP38/TMEM64 family)
MPPLVKRFGPIALVILALVGAYAAGLHNYLSFEALAERRAGLEAAVKANPLLVALIYMAIYAAIVAASVPGALWVTIAGGFLFGPWVGTALAVTGATIGAMGLFFAAQSAAGGGLRAKAGSGLEKFEAGFKENAFSYLLTLRLLPIAPFFLVNIAAAVLGVNWRTFLIATFIGIIPGALVYAAIGNGLGAAIDAGKAPDLSIATRPEIILPLIGLAALSLAPVVWKRVKGKSA